MASYLTRLYFQQYLSLKKKKSEIPPTVYIYLFECIKHRDNILTKYL